LSNAIGVRNYRMTWLCCVTEQKLRNAYKILVRKSEQKKQLGVLSADEMIILNFILSRV
jgi:hypothetical protein